MNPFLKIQIAIWYSHYLPNIRIFARIVKIRYSQLRIAGLLIHKKVTILSINTQKNVMHQRKKGMRSPQPMLNTSRINLKHGSRTTPFLAFHNQHRAGRRGFFSSRYYRSYTEFPHMLCTKPFESVHTTRNAKTTKIENILRSTTVHIIDRNFSGMSHTFTKGFSLFFL